jgi:hypothetical protein
MGVTRGDPLYFNTKEKQGTRDDAVCRGTAPQAGKWRVCFPMVSLEVFFDFILPAALRPWGRLSLKQKSVPRIFPLGGE